jgi:hypothetical protein
MRKKGSRLEKWLNGSTREQRMKETIAPHQKGRSANLKRQAMRSRLKNNLISIQFQPRRSRWSRKLMKDLDVQETPARTPFLKKQGRAIGGQVEEEEGEPMEGLEEERPAESKGDKAAGSHGVDKRERGEKEKVTKEKRDKKKKDKKKKKGQKGEREK